MRAKKQPSGRRSVHVEVEVPASTLSAVTRRLAEAQLRTLIAKLVPAHLRLINAMRRSLRKRLPTAHEVVYEYRDFIVISFSPNEHGYDGVLAIRASAEGVRLYFNRGKELPDPEKLLQGSGKQTRLIDVEGASTLALPAVARLIDEAIAHNHVPFEGAGGSVVIRSASTKQRPRASLRSRGAAIPHKSVSKDIAAFNERLSGLEKDICDLLASEIDRVLPDAESKIWHAHPVWFLNGNPIVGYSKQKLGIRLMFWSGADFQEPGLDVVGKKFKDASVFFNSVTEIKKTILRRWLKESKRIQWDYKNIVKLKGKLVKLE